MSWGGSPSDQLRGWYFVIVINILRALSWTMSSVVAYTGNIDLKYIMYSPYHRAGFGPEKAWKECVIGELAMMKRSLHRRIARRADFAYNKDSRRSFASESDGGLRDNSIVQGCDARNSSELKSNKILSQQEGSKHPASLHPSRFTVSLIVPRPEQHTVLNTSITGGSRDHAIRSDFTETPNAASSASNTKRTGEPAKGSIKNTAPSSGSSTIKPANQSGSSVIRLDIVREDAEREQGGPLSPRRDRSALDNKAGGEREGEGAERVASARSRSRSDSTAKELLEWYTDEQVFPDAN